jgi:hypothetical protein
MSSAEPARAKRKAAAKPAAKAGAKPPAAKPVLRPVAKPRTADRSDEAKRLAAALDQALEAGALDVLSPEALQALLASLCKNYSARIEAGEDFLPLSQRGRVTPTDVMVTASKLLKSANLQVFELGMWQSWTGR